VRYAPTLDEELANIARVTVDDVREFHARFVGASHGEIAVVGDFDPATIRPLIEELFGTWKSPAPYTRVANPYRPTTATEMRFETPDKANAIILGARTIRLRDLDPDFAALDVAERILGGSTESRLNERLRVKDGLSYGVGSFMQPGQIDDKGSLGFYAIFAPKELPRVRAAFDEELKRLLQDGVTESEVAAAKRAQLEERRTNRAQDGVITGALVAQSFLGRTFAESARTDAAIENVDVAQANAALRKYLVPGNLAWAFAGDFAKK